MARRQNKRAKRNNGTSASSAAPVVRCPLVFPGGNSQPPFSNPPLFPATPKEKWQWSGFVERESDPTAFNNLLRSWGVHSVRLQEVFDLESLPSQSTLGLVFLQDYKSRPPPKRAPRPRGVWFANQVADDACSTISMLNMLTNLHGVSLGHELADFKAASADISPVHRGYAVMRHQLIRGAHNKLARKTQMLQSDKVLADEYDKANKRGKKRKAVEAFKDEEEYDEEQAKHYFALVPVDGTVWLLDGLERQPEKLGTFAANESWIDVARAALVEEIEGAGGNINMMAAVREPLAVATSSLAANVLALKALDKELAGEGAQDRKEELVARRKKLLKEQTECRGQVKEAAATVAEEEAQAAQSGHDHTAFTHQWLWTVARKGGLSKRLAQGA